MNIFSLRGADRGEFNNSGTGNEVVSTENSNGARVITNIDTDFILFGKRLMEMPMDVWNNIFLAMDFETLLVWRLVAKQYYYQSLISGVMKKRSFVRLYSCELDAKAKSAKVTFALAYTTIFRRDPYLLNALEQNKIETTKYPCIKSLSIINSSELERLNTIMFGDNSLGVTKPDAFSVIDELEIKGIKLNQDNADIIRNVLNFLAFQSSNSFRLITLSFGEILYPLTLTGLKSIKVFNASYIEDRLTLENLPNLKRVSFLGIHSKLTLTNLESLEMFKSECINNELSLENIPNLKHMEFKSIDCKLNLENNFPNLTTIKLESIFEDSVLTLKNLKNLKTVSACCIFGQLILEKLPNLMNIKLTTINAKLTLENLESLTTVSTYYINNVLTLKSLPNLKDLKLRTIYKVLILENIPNLKTFESWDIMTALTLENFEKLETVKVSRINAIVKLNNLLNLSTLETSCIYADLILENLPKLMSIKLHTINATLTLKNLEGLTSLETWGIYERLTLKNLKSLEKVTFTVLDSELLLEDLPNLKVVEAKEIRYNGVIKFEDGKSFTTLKEVNEFLSKK